MATALTFTKDQVKERLATSQASVERALLAIYAGQTEGEKSDKSTDEDNGIGFNGPDAFILSSFAEWILKGQSQYNKKIGSCLTTKQLEIARKRLPKYAQQLLNIHKATLPS